MRVVRTSSIDALISKARSVLSRVRIVRAGDYVLSEDHNLIVEALRTLEQLSEALKDYADTISRRVSEVVPIMRGLYKDVNSVIDVTLYRIPIGRAYVIKPHPTISLIQVETQSSPYIGLEIEKIYG